jgi:hypothetical protein
MKACTRCGAWHTNAEELNERYMSCTDVKRFWSDIKRRHQDETGHLAMIKIAKDGRIVCLKCGRDIILEV